MTYEDFVEFQKRVCWGEEFNFYYKNKSNLISQNADGYYLTRSKDLLTQTFDTANALFENGTIGGKRLSEIYQDIE